MKKYTTVIETTHGTITCEGTIIHNLAVVTILTENKSGIKSIIHDAEMTASLEQSARKVKLSELNEQIKEIYDADRDYETCLADLDQADQDKYHALRKEREVLLNQ